MLLVVQAERNVLKADLLCMLAVSVVADLGTGYFMMIAAIAGKERNLKLGQFHHELQTKYVGEELLRALQVADLNHDMSDSVRQYHWWSPPSCSISGTLLAAWFSLRAA